MKKHISAALAVLCIAVLLIGSFAAFTPNTISSFVSNVFDSAADVTPLTNDFNGRENYYYSHLDEKGKAEYTKIYNGYMNLKDFTVNLERDDFDYMFNCVLYDNPEIFWVDSSYSFSKSHIGYFIEPDYRFTADEIKTKSTELKSAVDAILSRSGSDISDYGKEKFFHDYICENTVYDFSTYEKFGDTAYSVFIDGKAICEGYSRAFKMLLDASGIYNYLVIGKTKNEDGKMEGHMWNVVSVDGELYHIDVTWDDSDGELGEKTNLYFNLTDADIRKDHYDIVPYENNCNSIKYNYFYVNGLMFSSFNNFNGMSALCAAGINEDLILEMRFSDDLAYSKIRTKALNNETDRDFFDFTVDVARLSGKNIKSKSYIYDDKFNYICIVFEKG